MRLYSCTLRLCRVNKPNQHDRWWYSCYYFSFNRLSCETKAYDQSKSQERLIMKQVHRFGTVCEGRSWNEKKWCRGRVCLCNKVVIVAAYATLSRDGRTLARLNRRCDIGLRPTNVLSVHSLMPPTSGDNFPCRVICRLRLIIIPPGCRHVPAVSLCCA